MTAHTSSQGPALSLSKGFTLIELLIVISVLGILAVAVLSAINPIEQINRSRDTGGRSDTEQLIGAMDRYYATKGYYVWQSAATDTGITQAWQAVNSTWSDGVTPIVGGTNSKLASGGSAEIKESFADRITDATSYNPLYVYNRGQQGDSTYVCFRPKSSSFRDDAYTRCGTGGAGLPSDLRTISTTVCPNTTCISTNKTGCYSCLP